jgi:uncharacterized protein
MPIDAGVLAVIGSAVLLGAYVQGLLGFGVGIVAAPVITTTQPTQPTLMPTVVLILGAVFGSGAILSEWRATDMRGVAYALLGRVPGMVAGVYVVARLPLAVLEVVVAAAVLGAVFITACRFQPQRSVRALLFAGAASGITGTAAGIGGPPMALLYRDSAPDVRRATLGAFFSVGAVASLLVLSAAGEVTQRDLIVTVLLLPVLGAGFLLAAVTRARIDGSALRRGVLSVSTLAALALLVRALV